MRFGIIFAIPNETAHLQEFLDIEKTSEKAGLLFQEGKLEQQSIVLVEGGMGKVNAAVVTTLLVEKFGCDFILFSGIAGGLSPQRSIGDVILGEKLIQYDYGIQSAGEFTCYQPGHLPIHEPTERLGYKPSGKPFEQALEALQELALPVISAEAAGGQPRQPEIYRGTILTGDLFLDCVETRERLHAQHNADCVEMEGAAVAQVCERFGKDFLIIRSLSDLAGAQSNGMDFMAFLHETGAGAALSLRCILRAFGNAW
ncbi:5'-methylthioadenosine/adenosylhomocysteine nucleosidase [Kiloniella sp. b19]|uniref:5'-methylthioadenosine/adenosylhomocysteine nucleosidase n=1 Tax=Kiloniella sp. GXU_MW_B19 TaxID=3141326 RepID=UPI0031E41AB2